MKHMVLVVILALVACDSPVSVGGKAGVGDLPVNGGGEARVGDLTDAGSNKIIRAAALEALPEGFDVPLTIGILDRGRTSAYVRVQFADQAKWEIYSFRLLEGAWKRGELLDRGSPSSWSRSASVPGSSAFVPSGPARNFGSWFGMGEPIAALWSEGSSYPNTVIYGDGMAEAGNYQWGPVTLQADPDLPNFAQFFTGVWWSDGLPVYIWLNQWDACETEWCYNWTYAQTDTMTVPWEDGAETWSIDWNMILQPIDALISIYDYEANNSDYRYVHLLPYSIIGIDFEEVEWARSSDGTNWTPIEASCWGDLWIGPFRVGSETQHTLRATATLPTGHEGVTWKSYGTFLDFEDVWEDPYCP